MTRRSPAKILHAAEAALRSANGFALNATIGRGRKALTFRVISASASKFEVGIADEGESVKAIAIGGHSYLRANKLYWTAQRSPMAGRLANHWVVVPARESQQLVSSLGSLSPKTLATCLGEDVGSLSQAGTTSVDGKRAIVLGDKGNVPGGTPSTLAVAENGPAYPLRLTATGPTRGGGKVDACNNGKGDDAEGTVTLSDFGHPPTVIAPKHPLKISSTSTPTTTSA